MKIVKLCAENVKKLKAVEITPEGNMVVISGKNGAGKTSVLDAIWFALGGKRAAKDAAKPVREGENKAQSVVDLGALKVTRKWTAKGTTSLAVESANGMKHTSPQAVLDALIGELSFDPLAFAEMPEKEQVEALLHVLNLDIDPKEIDERRKAIYGERTDVNRDIKKLEAQLAGLSSPEDGVPEEEISSADLMDKLNAAHALDMENDKKRNEVDRLLKEAGQLKNEVEEMERELADKRRTLDAMIQQGKALRAEVDALVDPAIEEIQAKLNNVAKTNQGIRDASQYRTLQVELRSGQQLSDALTKKIERLDKAKADAIQAADLPIEGLSFDENGVTFNGIPFKQSSASEQLRVSLAIAMALNPELRVIRITDGSLLDSDNFKLIEQAAKAKDFQVWIEMVDESGKLGVVIEDGMVKA